MLLGKGMDMELQDILATEPWDTPHAWVYDQLFNDPDFTKPVDALIAEYSQLKPMQLYMAIRQDTRLKASIRQLATSLDIKAEFVQRYMEHKLTGLDVNLQDKPTVRRDGNHITITLNARTTKRELTALWPQIDELKRHIPNSIRKWKQPENAALLYAIYKRRKANDAYSKIFSDYQQNKLPGWHGKPTQYKDQETMERRYRHHEIERILKASS